MKRTIATLVSAVAFLGGSLVATGAAAAPILDIDSEPAILDIDSEPAILDIDSKPAILDID